MLVTTAATAAAAFVVAALALPSGATGAQEPPHAAVSGAAVSGAAVSGAAVSGAAASISDAVATVPVEGAAFRAAMAAVERTGAELAAAQGTRAQAEARLAELGAREAALGAVIDEATARRDAAGADFDHARDALRSIAVASYVRGADLDPLEVLFDAERGTEIEGEALLIDTVAQEQVRRLDDARTRRDEAAGTMAGAGREREDVRAEAVATAATRDGAAQDEARLGARLGLEDAELDRARALATVVGADFPLVALDAYHRAATTLAGQQPGCGLPWWALAGIAKVESRHGAFRGTTLGPDGGLSRPIVGIPLDGTNETRLIGDTDGGALDGDAVVDRAVGPMQFIPTTWARWGRDGNGDGTEDPQNLYDAALGAAAYLCGAAPLDDDEGLRRAFLRYNASETYASEVLGWAHGYASVVVPEP